MPEISLKKICKKTYLYWTKSMALADAYCGSHKKFIVFVCALCIVYNSVWFFCSWYLGFPWKHWARKTFPSESKIYREEKKSVENQWHNVIVLQKKAATNYKCCTASSTHHRLSITWHLMKLKRKTKNNNKNNKPIYQPEAFDEHSWNSPPQYTDTHIHTQSHSVAIATGMRKR